MRAAILADIHSNLEAFTAVLEHIKGRGGADEIWCLGDVVGYGPDPHECIELLRGSKHICIAGNHDWAALEKIGTTEFNPDAAAAARWTAQQLAPEDVAYLESLPLSLERDGFTLAHGSPSSNACGVELDPVGGRSAKYKSGTCQHVAAKRGPATKRHVIGTVVNANSIGRRACAICIIHRNAPVICCTAMLGHNINARAPVRGNVVVHVDVAAGMHGEVRTRADRTAERSPVGEIDNVVAVVNASRQH